MIDPKILIGCHPGTTGYAACVMAKTGKVVANWYPQSQRQNEVVMAGVAIKSWPLYKKFKVVADEYFDHIPEDIIEAVSENQNEAKEVREAFARNNMQFPDDIAKYFA